jgi:hypothetical protein
MPWAMTVPNLPGRTGLRLATLVQCWRRFSLALRQPPSVRVLQVSHVPIIPCCSSAARL